MTLNFPENCRIDIAFLWKIGREAWKNTSDILCRDHMVQGVLHSRNTKFESG